MVGFSFNDSQTFEANWDSFLTEMEAADPEMAAILRANKDAVARIVNESERSPRARANFNSAIATALDALVQLKPEDGAK